MKKTTSTYKLDVKELKNREDHYHVIGKIGSYELDVVLERSSIRHIIEILDKGIETGL